MNPFPEAVYEHLRSVLRARAELLERDCARALLLQRSDMLDRLFLADDGSGSGWHVASWSWLRCEKCGSGHDGFPPGSLGAEIRCLREQATQAGLVGLVDQVDAFDRDLSARRDGFLFGPTW